MYSSLKLFNPFNSQFRNLNKSFVSKESNEINGYGDETVGQGNMASMNEKLVTEEKVKINKKWLHSKWLHFLQLYLSTT